MPTTYPQDVKSSSDLVKGDFAENQYRGATRLQGLIDLGVLTMGFPMDIPVTGGSVTTVAPSWQTLFTGTLVVPHLVEAAIADRLVVIVDASLGGGSQSGSLRVNLSGITASSTYETVVTETSPTEKVIESTPVVAEELDALTAITFTVEGNVDNGAWTMTVTAKAHAVYWSAT